MTATLTTGDYNLIVSGLGLLLREIEKNGEEYFASRAEVLALRNRIQGKHPAECACYDCQIDPGTECTACKAELPANHHLHRTDAHA